MKDVALCSCSIGTLYPNTFGQPVFKVVAKSYLCAQIKKIETKLSATNSIEANLLMLPAKSNNPHGNLDNDPVRSKRKTIWKINTRTQTLIFTITLAARVVKALCKGWKSSFAPTYTVLNDFQDIYAVCHLLFTKFFTRLLAVSVITCGHAVCYVQRSRVPGAGQVG